MRNRLAALVILLAVLVMLAGCWPPIVINWQEPCAELPAWVVCR